MVLSKSQSLNKLKALAEDEGYDTVDGLIAVAASEPISPAICTAEDCDYTAEMEPDQDRGWCESCGRNTVASALVLAELI